MLSNHIIKIVIISGIFSKSDEDLDILPPPPPFPEINEDGPQEKKKPKGLWKGLIIGKEQKTGPIAIIPSGPKKKIDDKKVKEEEGRDKEKGRKEKEKIKDKQREARKKKVFEFFHGLGLVKTEKELKVIQKEKELKRKEREKEKKRIEAEKLKRFDEKVKRRLEIDKQKEADKNARLKEKEKLRKTELRKKEERYLAKKKAIEESEKGKLEAKRLREEEKEMTRQIKEREKRKPESIKPVKKSRKEPVKEDFFGFNPETDKKKNKEDKDIIKEFEELEDINVPEKVSFFGDMFGKKRKDPEIIKKFPGKKVDIISKKVKQKSRGIDIPEIDSIELDLPKLKDLKKDEEEIKKAISDIKPGKKKNLISSLLPKKKKKLGGKIRVEMPEVMPRTYDKVDQVLLIEENIHRARMALMNFKSKKAKKLYIDIIKIYNNLDDKKKSKVYQDIKELYYERKSAEKYMK